MSNENVHVQMFYDEPTGTLSYVVWEDETKNALIIDPVLNFDWPSSTSSTDSVKEISAFIIKQNLTPLYCFETHIHADHISGSYELKKLFPKMLTGINFNVEKVFTYFFEVYQISREDLGTYPFDLLVQEGDSLPLGNHKIEFINSPGHTPACMCIKIENNLFAGDALFMPDFGVGRCDFPGGGADTLFASIQRIYNLDENIKVFVGHDYKPNNRELKFETTIKESKEKNIHLNKRTTEQEFVRFRSQRDKTLSFPKLLLPSIFLNLRSGNFPTPEANGVSYLKIPLNYPYTKLKEVEAPTQNQIDMRS